MPLTQKHKAEGGIYAIEHIPSGMLYVGSTANFKMRWKGHRTLLRAGSHSNMHLQKAWNKYGEQQFYFKLLEVVENADDLLKRELHWFGVTSCCNKDYGYNITSDPLRRTWSKEQREALSASTKGRVGRKHSAETRTLLSAQRKGIRVYQMTDEVRKKMSIARTGTVMSHETRVHLSNVKRAFDKNAVRVIKEAISMGWLIGHIAHDIGVNRHTISKIKNCRGPYAAHS